jgi:hypothetical protein
MLAAIRRLLIPDLSALLTQVEGLQRQVRALEAERLALLTEWVKTRDQVLRYMKRAGAMRASLRVSDGGPEDGEEDDDDTLDLLRAKHGV